MLSFKNHMMHKQNQNKDKFGVYKLNNIKVYETKIFYSTNHISF